MTSLLPLRVLGYLSFWTKHSRGGSTTPFAFFHCLIGFRCVRLFGNVLCSIVSFVPMRRDDDCQCWFFRWWISYVSGSELIVGIAVSSNFLSAIFFAFLYCLRLYVLFALFALFWSHHPSRKHPNILISDVVFHLYCVWVWKMARGDIFFWRWLEGPARALRKRDIFFNSNGGGGFTPHMESLLFVFCSSCKRL